MTRMHSCDDVLKEMFAIEQTELLLFFVFFMHIFLCPFLLFKSKFLSKLIRILDNLHTTIIYFSTGITILIYLTCLA